MTYREIITNYVKSQHPRKVPSWELQSHKTDFGWLGPSADRDARNLAVEGILQREKIMVLDRHGRKRWIAHYSTHSQLSLF